MASPSTAAKCYALLVGNARYDAGFESLPSTHVDVARLKRTLEHERVGPYEVEVGLDLSRSEMMHAIERFLAARKPEDLALLYISGHGDRLRTTTGEFYFIASDTASTQEQYEATAVSSSFVNQLLERCPATQKVAILDSCYSGGFTVGFRTRESKAARPSGLSSPLTAQGVYVLASSTVAQPSFGGQSGADGDVEPSVFTGHIIEALSSGSADRDSDGLISVDDLFASVSQNMNRRTPGAQTPVKSAVGVTGQIVLAKRISGPPLDVATMSISRLAAQSTDRLVPQHEPVRPTWPMLLDYYRACTVANQDAFPLLSPEEPMGDYACVAGAECIVSGSTQQLVDVSRPVHSSWQRLVQALGDDKELWYGYPVVVLREAPTTREPYPQPRFAPLWMRKVNIVGSRLQLEGDVRLHPTLAKTLLGRFDRVASTWIDEQRPGWESGQRDDARRAIVRLLNETFRVNPGYLNLDELTDELELGAPSTHVCNTGLYFVEDQGSSRALKRLLADLCDIRNRASDIPRTALGCLLSAEPTAVPTVQLHNASGRPWQLCAALPINDAQLSVLQSAMMNPLTVTVGPPGTGKSQLVANLISTCVASGQTVLLTSTNNGAVDVVCARLNALVPNAIIRTGNRQSKERERRQLSELLEAGPVSKNSSVSLAAARSYAESAVADLDHVRDDMRKVSLHEEQLLAAVRSRGELESRLSTVWRMQTEEVRPLLQQRCMSRWAHLFEVAAAFGSGTLARVLRFLLLLVLRLPVRDLAQSTCQMLVEWTHADSISVRTRRRLDAGTADDDLSARLRAAEQGVQRAAAEWLRQVIQRCAGQNRPSIEALLDAGRSGKDWRERVRALDGVRAWAITNLSARVLPTYRTSQTREGKSEKSPLFDLVIVDEASQCSIAQVVPVLFRARRALIIGDPKQLAPVLDLPDEKESIACIDAGLEQSWLEGRSLSAGRFSAFDAAAHAAGSLLLLDEHYRCDPQIAEFANNQFYAGQLTVLTERKTSLVSPHGAIRWIDVRGVPSRRGGTWINPEELACVEAEVARLQAQFPTAEVGVISPANGQAEQLRQRYSSSQQVKVGTVHKFQGEERDIIVLSPVLGDDMPAGSRWWFSGQRNLWNVAITRARSQLIVVGDRAAWLRQGGIGGELVKATEQASDDECKNEDDLRSRLYGLLKRQGFQVQLGVRVSGYVADAIASHGAYQVALLIDRGCGEADPVKHMRVQLRRTALLSESGCLLAQRVPAWRLMDSEVPWTLVEPSRELGTPEDGYAADGVTVQDPT